jgi:hypothetical protein
MSDTPQPVRRFTLASWVSIYGRNFYDDFVKESDYSVLERELSECRRTCAELVTDGNAVTLAQSLQRMEAENALLKAANSDVRRIALERDSMRALLERIRTEPALLKRGAAGGQDQYAGMPPAYRLIDSELKRPWSG